MSLFSELNLLPEIISALGKWGGQVTETTAKEIANVAAANAPVATGFLQSSIYVSGPSGSTYGQGADGDLLPEEHPDKGGSIVAVAAPYGEFVEMGTAHDGAQPYLTPAADMGAAFIESQAGSLEGFLGKV